MSRFQLLLSAIAIAAVSCSHGDASRDPAGGLHADSANGIDIASDPPYVPGDGSRPGTLVVTVARDSSAARTPNVVATPCEVAAQPSDPTTDVVVWIDGLSQGKKLPMERRYELTSVGCALTPRVQAVAIGGTVNVFNGDAVTHRLVFMRGGTNDTLQTMPFTEPKQIVATERLTKSAGFIEVRCATHPQERAYIVVFDHPYFDVAAVGDKVTFDSMPPGSYTVMTWREGMAAPFHRPAAVGASGTTSVTVR